MIQKNKPTAIDYKKNVAGKFMLVGGGAKGVAPLVMNTNPLFTSVIINAWGAPTELAANIMIIFGHPGFAPGGINGIAGSRFSIKLRARA